jgi:GT2 family glycosyltransferase
MRQARLIRTVCSGWVDFPAATAAFQCVSPRSVEPIGVRVSRVGTSAASAEGLEENGLRAGAATRGKILVVLPTLGDRLDSLAETFATIAQQRAQVELTLVVILPEAAVEARALAASFDAIVVHDPGQGISEAINVGVRAATDERYYAWIGDDDLFRDGGLRTLRDLLDADPAAVVAYGGCDYIDAEGRTIGTSAAGRAALWLLPWGPDLIPHPGSIIRLDALRAIGLFDTSLRYAMDLDAFLSLRSHGRFLSTRTSVSAFRWHPDSLTVANREGSSREARLVKTRHLPGWLRPVSPLWSVPVAWAAAGAARAVSKRARRLASATTREKS